MSRKHKVVTKAKATPASTKEETKDDAKKAPVAEAKSAEVKEAKAPTAKKEESNEETAAKEAASRRSSPNSAVAKAKLEESKPGVPKRDLDDQPSQPEEVKTFSTAAPIGSADNPIKGDFTLLNQLQYPDQPAGTLNNPLRADELDVRKGKVSVGSETRIFVGNYQPEEVLQSTAEGIEKGEIMTGDNSENANKDGENYVEPLTMNEPAPQSSSDPEQEGETKLPINNGENKTESLEGVDGAKDRNAQSSEVEASKDLGEKTSPAMGTDPIDEKASDPKVDPKQGTAEKH